MVETQRQVRDGSDRDRVVNDNRGLGDGPKAQDRDLRLVDRRRRQQRVVAAVVGHRERAAGDLVGLEFLGPGPRGEIVDRALEAQHALLVGVPDHRHDQPPIQGHRDADIHVLVQDHFLAVEGGVDRRERLERRSRGLQEERHVGQLDSVLLQETLLGRGPQSGDSRAVHRMDRRNVRGDALGPHHVLGDADPHGGQRLDRELAEAGFRRGRERR